MFLIQSDDNQALFPTWDYLVIFTQFYLNIGKNFVITEKPIFYLCMVCFLLSLHILW